MKIPKFITLIFLLQMMTLSLLAGPIYSFKTIGISYVDWLKNTEEKTSQRDFAFVKAEGGFGYESMDFYGYISLENPIKKYEDDAPHNQRYVGYGDLDIALKDGLKLHIQNFYLGSEPFYVNNLVVGFAYKVSNDSGFWFKPFIGAHYTIDTYFNGLNGYMTGWVLNYPFSIYSQSFTLFHWNEIEFARSKEFYESDGVAIGDGKNHGLNGSISLWWNATKSLSSGAEYRYAQHKLGSIEYQSAFIYTLRYAF